MMMLSISSLPSRATLRLPAVLLAVLLAAPLLSGCETPLNSLRAQRMTSTALPAPVVEPSALALALRVSADGKGLEPESLARLNQLLNDQGRLRAQSLSITPFNARGAQLAPRLAAALSAAGANPPQQQPLPTDAARLAGASAGGWDLELQSEAMVLRQVACAIAAPGDWAMHPYTGVGQLGCANRANIAAMVSDVRTLRRPLALAGADGRTAASAVERYQSGQIRELIDINFEE